MLMAGLQQKTTQPARCIPCPRLPTGPTVATAGLALQVPLAVLLDGLLRSPAWLSHAGSTVLTLVGGTIVLAGFFGVNAAGEDDEKTRHAAWEERQAVRRLLQGGAGGMAGAATRGALRQPDASLACIACANVLQSSSCPLV